MDLQISSSDYENDSTVELPIRKYKDEIILLTRQNQIIVVHGETGSGKTTQIPQYLLEAKLNNDKIIGITQPRKIGAVNMAKRVSEEMDCSLGKEVGYEIRFDNKSGASTKIKYMTDGILLNQCLTDRNLNDYGIIIIDEAHERVLRSDVLLGILKEIVTRRCDLKVIIASATLDTKKFSKYFSRAPIIYIEGSVHDVETVYREGFASDYKEEAIKIIRSIHEKREKGDILVFLTGRDDIEHCIDMLGINDELVVLPLYSALEYDQQQRIFDRLDGEKRKVVMATNIAETSITIDGIRHVIDCGYVKQTNYNSKHKMEVWEEVKISRAQADQRKGRAGRTAPGVCYRLYAEDSYGKFSAQTKPEMMRKNLSEIYLKVHAFGLNPLNFEFIDPPNQDSLLSSRTELKELNFLDEENNLTEDGERMLDLPVEPMIGKVLLSSIALQCVKRMTVVLAMLTENNIFKIPRHARNSGHAVQKTFFDPDGDPFMYYNVFQAWIAHDKSAEWCKHNFLDPILMEQVFMVQNQLSSIIKRRLGNSEIVECNENSAIKKAIVSGFYLNICKKTNRGSYERVSDQHPMFIHPSSSLYNVCPDYVLYFELKKQKRTNMFGVMKVDLETLRHFPEKMEKIGLRL